jgi:DNA-binding NtrC family response regulator
MPSVRDRIPVRAIIVDDDEAVCRKLLGWLSEKAIDAVTFNQMPEALRHAQRAPAEIALVDLRMPGFDGVESVAAMRRAAPHTRIISMTAFPAAEDVLRAIRAGARDLLTKPLAAETVLEAVERQLAEMGIPARTESAFNKRLGAAVRRHRESSGRTQLDVARAAGITPAQLSQIERGKTATSTWTLARICGVLRLAWSDLFVDS